MALWVQIVFVGASLSWGSCRRPRAREGHPGHLPEGMGSAAPESSLWLSPGGFSAVSEETIRPGFGAKMAEVTTALCARKRRKPVRSILRGKAAGEREGGLFLPSCGVRRPDPR